MRWLVRPARAPDVEPLAVLWHEADELHAQLSPGFFRRPERNRERERVVDTLRDADEGGQEVVLVACDDAGSLRGACHVQIYDTPRDHTVTPRRRAHVESLMVAPAARRTGCGRALMAAAADWARVRGASQIVLTVWAGNEAAQRFYAALGYQPISQVLGIDL